MQSRYFIGLAALLLALPAWAADVGLVGVFPGKAAVLVIDGGAPTAVRIGRTKHGVTVLSADESQAMIEIEGKRRTLRLGQYASSPSAELNCQARSASRTERGSAQPRVVASVAL